MPRNSGIEDFDDRELTRTLAGKKSSARLPILTSTHGLPLTHRLPILVTMPPLAFYIWQQLDYLREKGSRLAEWITNYAGVTLPRAVRLPILVPTLIPTLSKSVTHSPAWWRLLHLIWFHHRLKRQGGLLPTLPTTDEEQLVNGINENQWADELPPIVFGNLLPLPVVTTEPPDTTYDFLHPTYATPVHPQVDQIQRPNLRHIKHAVDTLAQANWQPQPTYRWANRLWSQLTQRSLLYRLPMKGATHSTHWSIPQAYAIPLRHRLYPTATGAIAEPDGQADHQLTLPYIAETPEVITLGEAAIHNLEDYNRPIDMETGNNLLYSLPDQGEPAGLMTTLERPVRIPKTASSFQELRFSPLKLNKEPALGLLATRATLRRAEMGLARWSLPLVKPLPEILGQKVGAINAPEDSGSMTFGQVMLTGATTDDISPGQGRQTGQTEATLIHRGSKSVARPGHQPSAITADLDYQPSLATESIYQRVALPVPQYFKSAGAVPPPDRSERSGFPWNQDYEPTSLVYKDTRQPAVERLLATVTEPKLGSMATGGESLPATFGGTAYYESQPTLELALAPVGRSAEEASPPPPKAEAKVEEETKEVATPDLDAIARDVYSKIKWRLKRERERAWGLS